MTDLRLKTAWRTACTPEELAEVEVLAERSMTLSHEREEVTAKLNRIRTRACQRLLAKARKAAR